jgi:hypothetical protein
LVSCHIVVPIPYLYLALEYNMPCSYEYIGFTVAEQT